MFPQSWSQCSFRPKFKRRRLSQIPTPRVNLWPSPGFPFATGATAPVRLAAGAILALSGAASWLLPDPWTPPPLTRYAEALEGSTCAPESGGTTSVTSPQSPASALGSSTCDAEVDGPAAGSSLAASTHSATSSSSTASSTATPSTESPDPPRARRGAPPTPRLLTLETISGVLITSRVLGCTRVGDGCCGLFGQSAGHSAGGSAPPSEQQGT